MKKKNYKKRLQRRMRTQAKELAAISKIAANRERDLGYCRYKYHFLLQDSIRTISLAVSGLKALSKRAIDTDFERDMDRITEKTEKFLQCLETGKY